MYDEAKEGVSGQDRSEAEPGAARAFRHRPNLKILYYKTSLITPQVGLDTRHPQNNKLLLYSHLIPLSPNNYFDIWN